jgi:hypothetical protein
LQKAQ